MRYLFVMLTFLIPSLLLCQDRQQIFKDVETVSSDAEEIFMVVEEMPRFPGCEDSGDLISKSVCSKEKLLEYIYTNLKYPVEAKTNGIEGTVVIQFVVDDEGAVTNAKVVRDIGAGCGQAALDVVNSMTEMTYDTITTFDESTYVETVNVITHRELWRPGYQRGKAVNVLYTLPINYKLKKEDQIADQVYVDKEKRPKTSTNYPPEYKSYQHYKDEVLTPNLVREAYTVDPIAASKIVGDIIPYGDAMHPILHKMGTHTGIDFRAVPGVAIMATADGVVEVVGGDHERYGQYVKIKHSEATQSLYAHMSSINVTEGQSVKAGEQIGAVGQSGVATYPHLHYEVYVNGQTEDPILGNPDLAIAKEDHQSMHHDQNRREDLKPLMVVDGEIQEDNFDIKLLDPSDIKAVNVLKDQSAIEKYGEAATYGVVEITLKDTAATPQKTDKLSEVQFDLKQNYPNPVGDHTTISFYLPNDRPASLLFYSQAGEYVYGIKDSFSQGLNEVKISTADLNASGMIYYFLIQDRMTAVKKMIVTK